MNQLILAFTLLLLSCGSYGARILGVFPMAAKSHHILASAYMRALAEAGHDVTVISSYREEDLPKGLKYKDVVLTGFKEEMEEKMDAVDMFAEKSSGSSLAFVVMMTYRISDLAEQTINHPNVKRLLQSNAKFDLVVVEQFLMDSMKVFANHYNAPQILFSSQGANSWVNDLVANPAPPSYIPESLLNLPPKMTFCQRVLNTIYYVLLKLLHHFLFLPRQNQLVKKYFPNSPELIDINYNASLVFLNSYPGLNDPVPLVPCMIEIGGIHVKPPKKLPKDLQDFLDNAKDGVIYFSMGSNLKSKKMPEKIRTAILNSFRKLKQKILWKWEDDVLPDQPSNVRLDKWLPQQDILAHPNVKLFITHGGLMSSIETIYHGVPTIAIPVYGDQNHNAKSAELSGYSLTLELLNLTEESLTKVLQEILTNPKYSENAKARSRIFNDRVLKPKDTAVFWTEYVLRHNGAQHLRVAGLDLPWYKYLLLDVLAFIGGVLLISIIAVCHICKWLCSRRKKGLSVQQKEKTN